MTDRQQEQIALHALGALTPEEARLLEGEWRYDARLREEHAELQDTAAEIARLLPEEAPPEELRAQLLKKLKAHRRAGVTPFTAPLRLLKSPWVAWAAAAAIAVAAAGLWTSNRQLEKRVTTLVQSEAAAHGNTKEMQDRESALKNQVAQADSKISAMLQEIEALKKGFEVKRVEVAMLRASVKKYEEGEVMVVWDQDKQEGLIKLSHMPPAQTAKDYQLWVFCSNQATPVNAGVVQVNDKGEAVIPFKPTKHIGRATRFALSLEKQGGVQEVEGQVILASAVQ